MSNTKIIGLFLVAKMSTMGVFAQEATFKPYFYLGAGGGMSDFSDLVLCNECGDLRDEYTHIDDQGRSTTGFAGYRFHKYLAVELSAYSLGSANFSIVEEQEDHSLRRITYLHASSRGVNASLKGILPTTKRMDLFAKVGWHYYDLVMSRSFTDPPEVNFDFERFAWTSTDLSYSAGIDYNLGKAWRVGAAFETFVGDTGEFRHESLEEDDLLDPSSNYRFDLRNISLYFAYRF